MDEQDEILLEIGRECLNPRFEQWELLTTSDNASFYRRLHPSGLYEWCTHVIMENMIRENLFEMACDMTYIKKWNTSVKETSVRFVDGKRIVYWQSILPTPMANRDFVLHTAEKHVTIDGRDLQVLNVVTFNDYLPEREGIVRVTDLRQIICAVVDDHQPSNVVVCSYIYQDPKGYIPKWLINHIVKIHFKKQIGRLRDAYDNYDNWKLEQKAKPIDEEARDAINEEARDAINEEARDAINAHQTAQVTQISCADVAGSSPERLANKVCYMEEDDI